MAHHVINIQNENIQQKIKRETKKGWDYKSLYLISFFDAADLPDLEKARGN